jgi:hypothetical protein
MITYQTDNPDIITAWTGVLHALGRYRARIRELAAAAGAGHAEVLFAGESGPFPGKFTGIDVPAGRRIPEGWMLWGSRTAVPDRDTGPGSRLAAGLDSVRYPRPRHYLRDLGMPVSAVAPDGTPVPTSVSFGGGFLRVHWGEPGSDGPDEVPGVDPALWRRSDSAPASGAPGGAAWQLRAGVAVPGGPR